MAEFNKETKDPLEESKLPEKPKKLFKTEETKISELANSSDPQILANTILKVQTS